MNYSSSLYDVIPYHGTVTPDTDLGHLSICSLWQKGPQPPLQRFCLAELGCGDCANLLPVAFYDPHSVFIGIDNSKAEMKRAKQCAKRLELKNIRFVLGDIRELDSNNFAPCDYIIAHGLFSWVPSDVRYTILDFCRKSLSSSGLAYISYNAQPGWSIRRLVREALLRDRMVQEAAVGNKAQRAIEVATRLLEDLPSRDYAHSVLLAEELERVRDGNPGYVFHEYLAEVNEGFWLRDFVEHARRNGLRYVADAQFCRWEGYVPDELRNALAKRDLDPIEQEEAADLLGNRYFRASILCRDDAPRSSVSHRDIIEKVFIATSLHAVSDPFDPREGVVETFAGQSLIGKNAPEITLNAAITKAAVVLLAAQWPFGMKFDALFDHATELLTSHGCEVNPDARSQLADELVKLFEAGQIDCRLSEPEYPTEISDYPKAHTLARYEAEHREMLTTPHHLPLSFDSRTLSFLRSLDGSMSQSDLERNFGAKRVNDTLEILRRWGLLEK